jgi:electron transfer flavoprotein alpha subunit
MSGETWVLVERRGDAARRASLEAIGKLDALGCEPIAVVLGTAVKEVAVAVAPYARRVLVADHPALGEATSELWARVVSDLAAARAPRAIVAGATSFGRDLCARLAARLRAGYVPDAIDLGLGADGDLVVVRPVLGGRAYAEVTFRAPGPRVVSVRPNAFQVPAAGVPGVTEQVALPAELDARRARVVAREPPKEGTVDLAEADVIVAGGRGVRGPEGFALLERLARSLGGAVGASRAAVDAGWREHVSQIGKSGRTVSPKLYLGFGVSGAVHHRMGMDTARTVVVVNADPNAPFFKYADYGLVGDLFHVVPAFVEELARTGG